MFLKELVDKNRVCFHKGFATWEEAVAASCKPLLDDGSIEQIYIDEVINCVKKYGPYIVFAPNVAMPHFLEGAPGVNNTAMSFMHLEEPAHFVDGDPEKDAQLFFAVASKDHDEHVRNMEKLCMLLLTPNLTEELAKVKNIEELLALDATLDV